MSETGVGEERLAPGFMAVHGNHPEALRDLMLAWMARHPLDPLEDECILVQSNGVAQWLKLSLARDAKEGGAGIAAAVQTQLPSAFIWQAYRDVLGARTVPAASPFDKSLLVWRLVRLLPELLLEPVFEPLARFLSDDADLRKRHQLAVRLADLFDQYQVYRADWLADWERGEDVTRSHRGDAQPVPAELAWQPRLWRALQADVGAAGALGSRAAVHQRFLAAARDWPATQPRPAGLPRRLVVFGISSLPQQALEVLAALARWVQVLLCVHNPSEHDWSHIVADRDLLRQTRRRRPPRQGRPESLEEDALHLHAQPLLAAWGKQGRDFIRLLDAHDDRERYASQFEAIGQRIDCFDADPTGSLLHQLQDDIRDLRPNAEARAHWPPLAASDRSIAFHVTHGPQREVEVLHDQLLAAFAQDASLSPRDVIVMVPDIAAYAPHVQAVFGLPAPGDLRHIPFSVSDQGQRHHDPLVGAVEQLMSLPQARASTSELLDLLDVPALRERFGIDDDALPLLHRWIGAANIRWGLHAEQRASLELPGAEARNTWDFGLQRMLLGYAVGRGDAWQGIEAQDEIGGLEAAALGPLLAFVTRLEALWRELREPCTPAAWGERLRRLLADFFAAREDGDAFTLARLSGALQDWVDACASADLAESLPLAVVREHWLEQIDQPSLGRPFLAGAVTFATLMPMRAIPFRFVALLGMNDGDYPRARVPMDFDLMASDWRAGDRSRREDDRYLFLEALLSARERLHISWVGRGIHDASERPPSVLVAQLRDHLASVWRLADDESLPAAKAGARLLHALTVEHRLQPFHADYFTDAGEARLFSYAHEWRPGVAEPAVGPDGIRSLPAIEFAGPLSLRQLTDFLKDPVRVFFQSRLGVHLSFEDTSSEDQEPFDLDGLDNWKLQDELIAVQREAVAEGQDRQQALQAQLLRIERRGELPAGAFAVLSREALAAPMDRLFADWQRALQTWPQAAPDAALDLLPEGLPEPLRLADWLTDLRIDADGHCCRLLMDSSDLVDKKGRSYRRDKLPAYWIPHLAAQAQGLAIRTLVIGKTGKFELEPIERAQALQAWRRLLDAWQEGLRRPLPLALKTALAWMEKGGRADADQPAALDAARLAYEGSDGPFGQQGEAERNAYLARAFPDFERLVASGDFESLAESLLRPMVDALGEPPAKPKDEA